MTHAAQTIVRTFVDLGVTLVYATVAGLFVAMIAMSDGGLSTLSSSLEIAALLPLGILVLMLVEAALRASRNQGRPRRSAGPPRRRFEGAAGPVLR